MQTEGGSILDFPPLQPDGEADWSGRDELYRLLTQNDDEDAQAGNKSRCAAPDRLRSDAAPADGEHTPTPHPSVKRNRKQACRDHQRIKVEEDAKSNAKAERAMSKGEKTLAKRRRSAQLPDSDESDGEESGPPPSQDERGGRLLSSVVYTQALNLSMGGGIGSLTAHSENPCRGQAPAMQDALSDPKVELYGRSPLHATLPHMMDSEFARNITNLRFKVGEYIATYNRVPPPDCFSWALAMDYRFRDVLRIDYGIRVPTQGVVVEDVSKLREHEDAIKNTMVAMLGVKQLMDAKLDDDDEKPFLRGVYEDMNAGLHKLAASVESNEWTKLLDREDAVAGCHQTRKEQSDTGAPHLVVCPEWRELQSGPEDTPGQAKMVSDLNNIYEGAKGVGGESEVLAVGRWEKLNQNLRQNRAWHKKLLEDEKNTVVACQLEVVEMNRGLATLVTRINETRDTVKQLSEIIESQDMSAAVDAYRDEDQHAFLPEEEFKALEEKFMRREDMIRELDAAKTNIVVLMKQQEEKKMSLSLLKQASKKGHQTLVRGAKPPPPRPDPKRRKRNDDERAEREGRIDQAAEDEEVEGSVIRQRIAWNVAIGEIDRTLEREQGLIASVEKAHDERESWLAGQKGRINSENEKRKRDFASFNEVLDTTPVVQQSELTATIASSVGALSDAKTEYETAVANSVSAYEADSEYQELRKKWVKCESELAEKVEEMNRWLGNEGNTLLAAANSHKKYCELEKSREESKELLNTLKSLVNGDGRAEGQLLGSYIVGQEKTIDDQIEDQRRELLNIKAIEAEMDGLTNTRHHCTESEANTKKNTYNRKETEFKNAVLNKTAEAHEAKSALEEKSKALAGTHEAAIRVADEELKKAAERVKEQMRERSRVVTWLETEELRLLGTAEKDALAKVQTTLTLLRQGGVTSQALENHASNVQNLSNREPVNALEDRARALFGSAMSQIMTESATREGTYVNFAHGGSEKELINAPPMQKYRKMKQRLNNVRKQLISSLAKLANAPQLAATRGKIMDSGIMGPPADATSVRLDNALTNAGDEQRFLRESRTFKFAHDELRAMRTPRDRHNRQHVAVRADIDVRAVEARHIDMTTHLGEIVTYANLRSKRAIHYYGLVHGILSEVQTAENDLPDTDAKAVSALPANPSSGGGNNYEGLSAIFENLETDPLAKLTHVLQQWASIRQELRGGAWPEPSVRDDLVKLASKDAAGNSPQVDEITGEITMTTNMDRLRNVSEAHHGLHVSRSVVPWVSIGKQFAVPVDEDCRTIRAKPFCKHRPQWQLHVTFLEQVETAADELKSTSYGDTAYEIAKKGVSARLCYRPVTQKTGDVLPPAMASRDPNPTDLKLDAAISHGINVQISRRDHAEKVLPELQERLRTFEDKIKKLEQLIDKTSTGIDGPLTCNLAEVVTPTVQSARLHSIADGHFTQTTRATLEDVAHARQLNQLLLVRDDLTAAIGRQRVAMGLQPLFVGDAEYTAFSTHPAGVVHVEVGERTDANCDYLDNTDWRKNGTFAGVVEEALKKWMLVYYGWQTDVHELHGDMFFDLALRWMTRLKNEGLPFAKLGLKRESGGSSSSSAPILEELITWNIGDRVLFGPGPNDQEPPTEEWTNRHPGWLYLATFDPFETPKFDSSVNSMTDLELRSAIGTGSAANTKARAAFVAAQQESSGASPCDGGMNTFNVVRSYCEQTRQMTRRKFVQLATAGANGHMAATGFTSDNGGGVFAFTVNPTISVEGVYKGPLFGVPVDKQNQVLKALTNNVQDGNSYCMVRLTEADNTETTCLAVSNKLPHWAQRPDGGRMAVVEGSNANSRSMKAAARELRSAEAAALELRSAATTFTFPSGDIISPFDSVGRPIQPRL